MKHTILFMTLILVCIPLISSCEPSSNKLLSKTDRMAETLDRATALEILKENEKKLLGTQGQHTNMRSGFYLPNVFAGPEEVSGQTSVTLSSLPRGQFLEEKFLCRLAKAGVLKQTKVENADKYAALGGPIKGLVVEYASRNPEVQPLSYNNNWFDITVGRNSFGKVVGIRQEGSEARVEVEVVTVPTDVYKRMHEIAAAMMAEEQIDPTSPMVKQGCGGGAWCRFLEVREESNTERFALARYDDGWRVVTH